MGNCYRGLDLFVIRYNPNEMHNGKLNKQSTIRSGMQRKQDFHTIRPRQPDSVLAVGY